LATQRGCRSHWSGSGGCHLIGELLPALADTDDIAVRGCPKWAIDSEGDRVQRMCYGMAAEACKVAMAWQKRLAREAG
jgi:hypothetical protein